MNKLIKNLIIVLLLDFVGTVQPMQQKIIITKVPNPTDFSKNNSCNKKVIIEETNDLGFEDFELGDDILDDLIDDKKEIKLKENAKTEISFDMLANKLQNIMFSNNSNNNSVVAKLQKQNIEIPKNNTLFNFTTTKDNQFSLQKFKESIKTTQKFVYQNYTQPFLTPNIDISFDAFITESDLFIKNQKNILSEGFSDQSIKNPFKILDPYARVLPVADNSEACFIGDIHGSGKSLVETIEDLINKGYLKDDLTIIKDNFYMIFLGDYVDRTLGGVAVLYLLMKLQQKNPTKVFLIKGNHENLDQNKNNGFMYEIGYRFGEEKVAKIIEKIQIIYSLLPSLILLSVNDTFLHCSHGGFDPKLNVLDIFNSGKSVVFLKDYRGSEFMIKSDSGDAFEKMENLVMQRKEIDFWLKWADFSGNTLDAEGGVKGCRIKIGTTTTQNYIQTMKKMMGIIRGHDHRLHGLKLAKQNEAALQNWNDVLNLQSKTISANQQYEKYNLPFFSLGPVLTFSTASDPSCLNIFDSVEADLICAESCYGILQLSKNISNWKLKLYNKEVRLDKIKLDNGVCENLN